MSRGNRLRNWDRLLTRCLLIVACWIAPTTWAQVAPLVPLGDDAVEQSMLPAGISRSKPELFGQYVHVWSLEDGTQVIQYYGDFTLQFGARRLISRDAVVWMKKARWKEVDFYHYDVFLSHEAVVRDAAGTIRTGPTLFVTFNSYLPAAVEMDGDTAQSSADSSLYQEAARVREQILAEQPEVSPENGLAVVNPVGMAEPQPKAKPIIRFRCKEPYTIDTKAGTIVLVGDVYISQGLVESGQFLEVRANGAVIFLTPEALSAEGGDGNAGKKSESNKNASPKDPLALRPTPNGAPGGPPSGRLDATNPLGGITGMGGMGVEGARSGVAGVYLKGDVVLTRGEQQIRAAELYYDIENDRALILDSVMRTIVPGQELPLYIRAEQIRQLSTTEYMARKARVSTSEFYTPHVHLGAERIYLTDATPRGEAGEVLGLQAGKYRARDVTLNAEGIPFFYLPYAAGDFRESESALRGITMSYSNDLGFAVMPRWYLFNLLGVEKPKGFDAILSTDYFSKRGAGIGLSSEYETKDSYGLFRSYYIHDNGEDRLGPFRDGTVDYPDRGRITWRHQQFFQDGWQLTLEGSYISDPNFLESFFNREFNEDKEQETLVYLKKQKDNWAVTALAQMRVLDYLTQTEHLPDVSGYWVGQPVGDWASFYNESHVGWVKYLPDNRRNWDKNRLDNTGRSDMTFRSDSRNEVDFPIKLGNAQVVPFAMGRSSYWDSSPHDSSIGRLFGSAGVRTSTQFWRLWEDVASRALDITGLRHIIKPEITAWFSGSNYDSKDLYPFDRGIEDIDDFYGTSLALRQRWQTKRGGPGNWRVVDWFTLDFEANIFGNAPDYQGKRTIGRYYEERPESSIARNHLRTNASWRISDTMVLLGDMNYSLDEQHLDLFDLSYVVEHTPRFSYVIGYRQLNDMNANLIGLGANYEINAKYKTAVRTYYDLERNKLQTFDVTLIRKWPRWYTAVTFGLDHIEKNVSISFSAWPEGAPQMALGSRKYTGLGDSMMIRRERD